MASPEDLTSISSDSSDQSDWSRTPAAMFAAAVLGLVSVFGLWWSVTNARSPQPEQTAEHQIDPIAPARLLVDLNTAGIDQLQMLPSIGPKLAQRIVDDREENGTFGTLDDLDRVHGIGPKTIAKLTDWVTISTP